MSCLRSQAKFVEFMEKKQVVRQYSLFQDKLVLKVSIDDVEVLQIVVDTQNLDFTTSLCDCSLEVLANESLLAVKLISVYNEELHNLGVV